MDAKEDVDDDEEEDMAEECAGCVALLTLGGGKPPSFATSKARLKNSGLPAANCGRRRRSDEASFMSDEEGAAEGFLYRRRPPTRLASLRR